MAEAAVGLAIGAVSLAALFTTCVDCFEYVQLGRQFGTDYQRSVLKLDIVKLRLSRWANAVNESQNHYSVPVGSDQEARQVEQILGEIISVFAAAEEVSQRYKSKAQPGDLVVYNADSDLEKDLVSMHNKMRDLALKRQKRSTFRQKAGLVDSLVELFPAVHEQQKQLSIEDAKTVEVEPRLDALEDAAEGVDELLQNSVRQVLASQGSHAFNRNRAFGEADVQYGDQYSGSTTATGAGHTYNENEASGKAKVQYGNIYRGY